MGFMDRNFIKETENLPGIKDIEAFEEACIYLELMELPAEERMAVVESAEFALAEQKGLIGKKTIVRLKLGDDLDRRETMAAFQLAREADDPLWEKLALNRVKERDLIGKIRTKYGSRASREAKKSQKDYVKKIKSGQFIKKADINDRA